ncbi:MAG: beta-propeller fold lactonase family protein [Chitinivibrionales bacterium]|nr:beta-propeller fold lactonase family protein [Chitinivibrionales bacterium]
MVRTVLLQLMVFILSYCVVGRAQPGMPVFEDWIREPHGWNALVLSADGRFCYAAIGTGAVAVYSRDAGTGELTFQDALLNDGAGTTQLDSASSIAISPDGAFIYVAAAYNDAINWFNRDSLSGNLTFVDAVWDGVDGVDGLDRVLSLVISPDGLSLYASSINDSAIAHFRRNSGSGALEFDVLYKQGTGGFQTLDGIRSLTVSPDGNHVYCVAGRLGHDALTICTRDTATGSLSYQGSMVRDLIAGTHPEISGLQSVIVSNDGRHLYASRGFYDAINTYARNSNGSLTLLDTILDRSNNVLHPNTLAESPDGKTVYMLTSQRMNELKWYARDSATGLLTYGGILEDSIDGADGLDGGQDIVVSADNRHVYVASGSSLGSYPPEFGDDGIALFTRDTTTGDLSYGSIRRGIPGLPRTIDGAQHMTLSSDNKHAYVTAGFDDALSWFSRNEATGELTFEQAWKDSSDGVHGLTGVRASYLSPDESNLYVAAYSSLCTFVRDTGSGSLTFVSSLHYDSANTVWTRGLISLAFSRDGRYVYAAGIHGMLIVRRDTDGGEISVDTVLAHGDGITGLREVQVSPDGKHVYTTTSFNEVGIFLRDSLTGGISYLDAAEDGVDSVSGLGGAWCLAMSPDGRFLFAAAIHDHALSWFERNPQTGHLTQRGAFFDGQDGVDGLYGPYSMAVSSDGAFVYVAGEYERKVSVFGFDSTSGELNYVGSLADTSSSSFGWAHRNLSHVAISSDDQFLYGISDLTIACFSIDKSTGALGRAGRPSAENADAGLLAARQSRSACVTIDLELTDVRHVRLNLYSIAGRLVKSQVLNDLGTGKHRLRWGIGALAEGVYVLRAHMGTIAQQRSLRVLH